MRPHSPSVHASHAINWFASFIIILAIVGLALLALDPPATDATTPFLVYVTALIIGRCAQIFANKSLTRACLARARTQYPRAP